MLLTNDITGFAKFIPHATAAEKESAVTLAIQHKITNNAIVTLIKKYCDVDVINAINVAHDAEEKWWEMATPFVKVYDAFLAKITADEWTVEEELAIVERDWREMLKWAISQFKYPRVSLEWEEIGESNDNIPNVY